MALIICPECGQEYSDRAIACPKCACPNSCTNYANSSTPKSRFKFSTIIKILIVILILAVVIGYVYKVYMYQSGLNAMANGDYSSARDYLEELNYKDSSLILNDISFLADLEKIILQEISYDCDIEYVTSTAESNLKTLRQYKSVEFYTDNLDSMVDQYIEGLERIIGAYDNKAAAAIQREMLVGKYYCDFVVVSLHNGVGFMQNNSNYADFYSNIIEEEEAMLAALYKLDESGHIATRNGEFWTNQVNLYLRNDTEYSFDQTYIFNFYNYNGDKLLETVTVDVLEIEPFTDYKVSISVPQSARNSYSVDYSYWYLDIVIPN